MKTAIFLGAGASKAEGAPLQGEIFRDYFMSEHFSENKNEMDYEIRSFFSSIFKINVCDKDYIKDINFPTFEEVLGILDLALLKGESLKIFGESNTHSNIDRIVHLRNHFVLLMAKIIEIKLESSNYYHDLLVQNLCDNNLIKDIVFISTNYDILIDSTLGYPYTGITIDYGVDFNSCYGKDVCKRPNNNTIKLFKLHGSLNWLFCPACNTLNIIPDRKVVVDLIDNRDSAKCRDCNQQTNAIIVAPTYFKNMNNVFLSTIWNKAEQALRDVERIIFCGYSFPDADIHIKYLLKRIESNRKKGLEVVVINNHNEKSDMQREEEKQRFNRFFSLDVKYTNLSFEDFSKNPNLPINIDCMR